MIYNADYWKQKLKSIDDFIFFLYAVMKIKKLAIYIVFTDFKLAFKCNFSHHIMST